MLSKQMRTVSVDEQALETLRYLATQVINRPMLYGLVKSDIERWDDYTVEERRTVMSRSVRRVSSVCPWVSCRVVSATNSKGVGESGPRLVIGNLDVNRCQRV